MEDVRRRWHEGWSGDGDGELGPSGRLAVLLLKWIRRRLIQSRLTNHSEIRWRRLKLAKVADSSQFIKVWSGYNCWIHISVAPFNRSAEYTHCSSARWFIYSEVATDPVTQHQLTHTRSNYLATLDGESQFCVCVCVVSMRIKHLTESAGRRKGSLCLRPPLPASSLDVIPAESWQAGWLIFWLGSLAMSMWKVQCQSRSISGLPTGQCPPAS